MNSFSKNSQLKLDSLLPNGYEAKMKAEMKKFQDSMKRLRKKHCYSQEKLAEIIGVDTSIIVDIENGDKQPDSKMIQKIGDALFPKTDIDMPESLDILSGVVCRHSQNMTDNLLWLLNSKRFFDIGKLKQETKLNTKFEISAYLIFIVDVFANQKQNIQARRLIFDVITLEIFKSLKAILPDYKEEDFNKKLDERIAQYGKFIREPNSIFEIPRDIKISKVLWDNLTNVLAQKGIFRSKKKQYEILSLAYGVACQKFERRLRIFINEILTENNDIRNLTPNEVSKLCEKVGEKIDEIEKNKS